MILKSYIVVPRQLGHDKLKNEKIMTFKSHPVNIILASKSPRRKDLLKKIIPEFQILPSQVEEEILQENDPVKFAQRAAVAKAKDVGKKNPSSLIIAADTVVYLEGEIFGKPKTHSEAKAILEKLSGKKHSVITAVALYRKDKNRLITGYEESFVIFKRLDPSDIEFYLKSSDYLDKAGGYAIQEIGDAFVEKLEGDYENVVGLPVKTIRMLLDEFFIPEHIVSIIDIALPNTWGVSKIDNFVTFIPGALVGDKARIKITKKKKRYQFGKIIRIEKPSPFRTESKCPHFGTCGGCAFQDLLYPKQLELKASYLLRTLQKIGKITPCDLRKDDIIPSPTTFCYRNKMEFAFGGENEEVFLGLRERTSPIEPYKKNTVPLQKCLIFSPVVEKIFPPVINSIRDTGLSSYNPMTQKGYFRNLVLREGKNTGEIMAVLVTRSGKTLDLAKLGEKLRQKVPEVKSFWWVENDRFSDVINYKKKKLISGRIFIEEILGGLKFRISPESFFQPNSKAAELLYERIKEEAQLQGSRRVLSLYCGPGSIEMFLSPAMEEVLGIDSEPANVLAAEENCRINDIPNCRFIEGCVENILKEHSFKEFDLVVIDPPRAGISAEGMKQILGLNSPRIIYLSCNSAAFARDVCLLSENEYRLQKLYCLDFFPHTPHLEVLGILTK